ncbi:MAG: DUF2158 domain-containing protein [Endozoicomonadaceae bacterium]|nr:DUF2158 domain-containing protein [Endozoicomonadaceae bacterium]
MEDKNTFTIGEIVQLKSGGPPMTVSKAITNLDDKFSDDYRCQWFDAKKLNSGVFSGDSLVKESE